MLEWTKLQSFVQWFTFAQNHISKVPSFACRPNCLLVLLQHSQQICNTFFVLGYQELRDHRRFRSIDKVVENFARCQTKMIGACMYRWTSCTYKKLWMDWDIIHIMLCYTHYCRCMWSFSDKHLEEETMMRVWEQNNYRKSSIAWFRDGVDLGAASRLVTRLESRFERVCSENRASLVVGSFSIDMSFSNLVDCNPSMLKTYILPKIILPPEWRGN